ncbi:MAG: 50S ribosomal protein L34e [Candidatus Aenigmatarchaeota archaeon]|nr:50S ribosomal protein L34e [Nanoarchaeota archaeon]
MPRPALRSRSMRRVKKKTPGGRSVIHYSKKKPKPAVCASCKAKLHGVPRDLPYKIGKLAKTKKRPERPFGGHLCSKCARHAIKSTLHLR